MSGYDFRKGQEVAPQEFQKLAGVRYPRTHDESVYEERKARSIAPHALSTKDGPGSEPAGDDQLIRLAR